MSAASKIPSALKSSRGVTAIPKREKDSPHISFEAMSRYRPNQPLGRIPLARKIVPPQNSQRPIFHLIDRANNKTSRSPRHQYVPPKPRRHEIDPARVITAPPRKSPPIRPDARAADPERLVVLRKRMDSRNDPEREAATSFEVSAVVPSRTLHADRSGQLVRNSRAATCS